MLQETVTAYRISGSEISTLKAGGVLSTVFEPKSLSEVDLLARQIKGFRLLGNASNVLIPDEGYGGAVLRTGQLKGVEFRDDVLDAGSGEMLSKLALLAGKRGLSGLERLAGIPGTVGGAVAMNAGAYDAEIGNLVKKVFVYRLDTCQIEEYDGSEAGFSYRNCRLKDKNHLIVGVRLALSPDSEAAIAEREKKCRYLRRISQPSQPSLGSVFKRYNGVSAGYYIENVGLKGETKGNMMISPCHANVIVNVGGGKAAEYRYLMNLAQKRVYEEYGIRLESEVEIFGEE